MINFCLTNDLSLSTRKYPKYIDLPNGFTIGYEEDVETYETHGEIILFCGILWQNDINQFTNKFDINIDKVPDSLNFSVSYGYVGIIRDKTKIKGTLNINNVESKLTNVVTNSKQFRNFNINLKNNLNNIPIIGTTNNINTI